MDVDTIINFTHPAAQLPFFRFVLAQVTSRPEILFILDSSALWAS